MIHIIELKRMAHASLHAVSWRNAWQQYEVIAVHIFLDLPIVLCKQIALSYVREYQPIFLHYHPEMVWVEDHLIRIENHISSTSTASIGEFVLPEAALDLPKPGSNGYVNALEELWELADLHDHTKACNYAVGIVMGIIMCKMDERWGSDNLEHWEEWYTAGLQFDDSDADSHRDSFGNSPLIRAIQAMEWISLANRLAMVT